MKQTIIGALILLSVVGIVLNLLDVVTNRYILTACYLINAAGLLCLAWDNRKNRAGK